eukprot:4717268-Ditylum_brightwellii.AAC.1
MGDLKKLGLEVNLYDSCVANKAIQGKQITVYWYVDDHKISHVDRKEVTKMIRILEEKCGKM